MSNSFFRLLWHQTVVQHFTNYFLFHALPWNNSGQNSSFKKAALNYNPLFSENKNVIIFQQGVPSGFHFGNSLLVFKYILNLHKLCVLWHAMLHFLNLTKWLKQKKQVLSFYTHSHNLLLLFFFFWISSAASLRFHTHSLSSLVIFLIHFMRVAWKWEGKSQERQKLVQGLVTHCNKLLLITPWN